jgi:hypothetical protein
MVRPKCTFCSSFTNVGHLTSMNFHCCECGACLTYPSWFQLFQCHIINLACAGLLYICCSLGFNGKWCNTFQGTIDFLTYMYLGSSHLIHCFALTCSPQNNMHPFGQMTSYVGPSLFKVFEASYSNDGNVFGVGNIFLKKTQQFGYESIRCTLGVTTI